MTEPSAESIAKEAARELFTHGFLVDAKSDEHRAADEQDVASIIQSAISRAVEEATREQASDLNPRIDSANARAEVLEAKVHALRSWREHSEAAEERERRMREALTDLVTAWDIEGEGESSEAAFGAAIRRAKAALRVSEGSTGKP